MKDNKINRRFFLRNSLLAGAATLLPLNMLQADNYSHDTETKRPKVIFFDVNETLLDLTQMKKSVGEALQGKSELLPLWFTTMLQYSLVATVGHHYEDFGTIGVAALQMVARNNGIELSQEEAKKAIVEPLRSLPAHPEVKAALTKLKNDGYKLVSLTNSSNKGVETQFTNAGLLDFFEERLSVEDLGKFKPDRDVYDWAARKMKVKNEECMMVAAHGWDIAGALWAGWRGAFISRPGQQLYPLADLPEISEPNLELIVQKLIALKK
ncbi:2-haloalkanoic acid dehalogenase, type II [Bernardetia litoralis DSM 6794]|uniref:2-haloalkanoic acid dehalogenase, type II n=1 Tax=Bernardetia litoralis (strain ATCC 23117 / DSM 6794 / NBRC 15988 / NCIMB 1366 / Fx l1 / Sio-4) TaxID=880071 RepID=I4ANC1_BERLS|nr:haloacid dehalogenase type II [Bernardetia litoralis]AFM05456.1 2-haloalkanoic acid dehalogenase, type II [Bernardetia litoralis DSM 6794]